ARSPWTPSAPSAPTAASEGPPAGHSMRPALGRSRLGLEEPCLVREHDRLDAVAEAQLLEDVRDVRLDRGASMDDAIADGIKSTAGVVTSAAVVMVAVFSVFATLSMLFFKQFGVGLAAAVLIDATIVRGVLLPAIMKLLGERNWYLPRWLAWLPRLEPEERAAVPESPPVPATF